VTIAERRVVLAEDHARRAWRWTVPQAPRTTRT
jgi:hypothetical protein